MVVKNKITDQERSIQNFKNTFYNLYGINLYIYTPLKGKVIISIKAFHDAALSALHKAHPDFTSIKHLSYRFKARQFTVYVQAMSSLAVKAGHTKVDVARFLNRHHASVIYSCKSVENVFYTNDNLIMSAYNNILKEL